MTLVSDIVQVNANGAFFNDVQLRAYREREMRELLARTYIFTTADAGQEVGSVELLDTMMKAYLPGQAPNRLMTVATFGHGKSHFAVAAATYFGSAPGDPALEGVMDGLRHAVSDPVRFARFESFKQDRRPFLVVLLSGDEAGDLPSKFSRALEEALESHEQTAGIKPPFWFSQAENFLRSIDASRVGDANVALEAFETDLAVLRNRVARREDEAYDMVREVFRALHGAYPDFQGATNLRQLVEWTVDNVCGAEGPMGGLLILFDEFSTFVQTYGAGRSGRHASPLQDLLNGVANRRERAAFVALGQFDPKETANQFSGPQLDSLFKELDRIEVSRTLKSVLEEVLDSYLKQEDALWDAISPRDPLKLGIDEACSSAWRLFGRRYERELRWNQVRFRNQVGYGCFPLHPTTTALFSTINYRATSNPRSVLRFVFDAAERRLPQPAVVDGRPNWTLPFELVDYFAEMLDPRAWEQYEEVQRALGGDITSAQDRALQAMLLIDAASVPTKDVGYAAVVASFAGLKQAEAAEVLDDLYLRGFIRHDEHARAYSFWPVGGGAYRLEQVIDKELRGLPSVTDSMLEESLRIVRLNDDFRDLEVPVQYGHPEDWLAAQYVVVASSLGDLNRLRRIASGLNFDVQNPSGPRGAVVWALATSDADVAWANAELTRIVDEALGDAEVPLVVMKPTGTSPQVLDAVRRVYVVNRLTPDKVPDGAEQQLRELKVRSAQTLGRALRLLTEASQPLAPRAFRADVAATGSSPEYVLAAVYGRAFRNGPRDFYPSYKVSSAPFAAAIVAVAQAMSQDNVSDQTALFATNKVATDLVDKVLRPQWGILGAGRRLQTPSQESPIYRGWRALNEAFRPGCTNRPLRPVLDKLLNAPYGYDPRTLTLLFAAWYGWHRHDLSLSVGGGSTTIAGLLKGGPNAKKKITLQGFLTQLSNGAITRRDEAEMERSVKEILDALDTGASQLDVASAESHLSTLRQFFAHPHAAEATKQRVAPVSLRLRTAIELAKDYDAKAASLLQLPDNWQTTPLDQLIAAISTVKSLPSPDLVRPEQPTADEIESELLDALSRRVENASATYSKLHDIGKFDTNQLVLKNMQRQVRPFPELALRLQAALNQLGESKRALEARLMAERQDEEVRAELRSMSIGPETGAASLQTYLERLGTLAPGTEACKGEMAQKREQVKRQLAILETRIGELERRLGDADSMQALSAVRDNALILTGRVSGSHLEPAASAVVERSEVLRRFFERLGDATKQPLGTPDEACRAEEALAAISQDLADVGETHRALVAAAIDRVRDHTRTQQHRAVAWIESLEEDVRKGVDPWTLDRRAANVPRFLPSAMEPRLANLRLRIRQAMDLDTRRQVVELFERIGDEGERQSLARDLWERAFKVASQMTVTQ